jgi:hypothetical protein
VNHCPHQSTELCRCAIERLFHALAGRMAGMIECLLNVALVAALISVSIWLGIDGETVKLIAVLAVGWILLWIASNSAHQDALRRREKTGQDSSES